MATTPISARRPKQEGGGGMWGKIAGLGAAVAAAPLTGGTSLSYAPAAMAGGGIIGNAISPAKSEAAIAGPSALETAAAEYPEMQMAQLSEAKTALDAAAVPEPQKSLLKEQFEQSQEVLKASSEARQKLYGRTVLWP